MSIQLDFTVQIAVLEPLQVVNDQLLELLDGFRGDDWRRTTVHKDRKAKDLTARLQHGSIRRVSPLRDGYRPPTARSFTTHKDLTQFIQEDNRTFMSAVSGVSPEILCERIRYYDPELMNLFKRSNPMRRAKASFGLPNGNRPTGSTSPANTRRSGTISSS